MLRQIVRFIQYALPDWNGMSLAGYSFNFDFSNKSATEDVNGYQSYSFQVLSAGDAQELLHQLHARFVARDGNAGMQPDAAAWTLPKLNWTKPVYLNIYIKQLL